MKIIKHYGIKLEARQGIDMPEGAEILAFHPAEHPSVSALIDPEARLETRIFDLIPADQELSDEECQYRKFLGSMPEDGLHLFIWEGLRS